MNNIGYACINMELSEQPKSKRVTTNRSMIKRTFQEKGVAYASELALANCRDLLTILKWNEAHGFRFFRLSSDLFPWASEYKLSNLPDFDEICDALQEAGDYVECAVSGKKIELEKLTYWSVELQEPYYSYLEAYKKREQHNKK